MGSASRCLLPGWSGPNHTNIHPAGQSQPIFGVHEQLVSDLHCLLVIPTEGRNPDGATMANVMTGKEAGDSYGMMRQKGLEEALETGTDINDAQLFARIDREGRLPTTSFRFRLMNPSRRAIDG